MIRTTLLATAVLLAPAPLFAQVADHDDVEVIQAPESQAAGAKKPDLKAATKAIVDQTNAFRAKEGRTLVRANPKLTSAAEAFAAYMAKTGRFGHTADGSRPTARAVKQGYEYCIVAENIAYEFDSGGFATDDLVAKFVAGWEKSPGHRRNMLDPDVTETGVAIAQSPTTGYCFAVQMFGRPKSLALRFKVHNESGKTATYRIGDKTYSLPPRYTRTHEQCRPTEVIFEQSAGNQKEQTFKPKNGERFSVTRDGVTHRLQKE
jgi:uncharacterized protein YkwD